MTRRTRRVAAQDAHDRRHRLSVLLAGPWVRCCARLLHFTIGSLSIASGLILVIIAVFMVLGPGASRSSTTG